MGGSELGERACELEEQGKLAEATECLRQAVAEGPTDGSLRIRLARLLGARRGEGDEFREEAIEQCRSLISAAEDVEPATGVDVAQAYFLLGSLLDDLPERYEEAEAAYRCGLELDDFFVVAHNNLGAVLCELGRVEEAVTHFVRAVEIRPSYTKVYQNLAKVYFRRVGQESYLYDTVQRLIAEHPDRAKMIIPRLMMALAEFARTDAWEDFYTQGHRLKNHLAILGSRLKRLKRTVGPEDEQTTRLAEELGAIGQSVSAATNELRGYLQAIRPQEVTRHAVDLNAVVRSVMEPFRDSVAADVKLSTNLAPYLPHVIGDPASLGEAVTNLLTNALNAINGAGAITVSTVYERDRAEVVVSVEDSGPGIPEEQRRDIFRPGVTTKSGGNGLGLAIVQRTMQEMGGRASVEISPLGGARFLLFVPTVEGDGEVASRGLAERCVRLQDTSSLIVDELTD